MGEPISYREIGERADKFFRGLRRAIIASVVALALLWVTFYVMGW